MDAIPLFVIEEHHEAFLIWQYAILRGLMPPRGTSLLHCDSHGDMRVPLLATPIGEIPRDLPGLRDFTYSELNIATFIAPALYQRIFDRVCWLAPRAVGTDTTVRRMYLRTLGGEGRFLVLGPDPGPWTPTPRDQDRVSFLSQVTTAAGPVDLTGTVVLDIDLDYFSCEAFAKPPAAVEVTREEYSRFLGDRYHPLRTAYACRAYEKDGRCYLHLNPMASQSVRTSRRLSSDAILERLDAFLRFLEEQHVEPCLVLVCRSRLTGYTPKDQWEFIEEHLLARIGEAYPVSPRHIEEVLAEPCFTRVG